MTPNSLEKDLVALTSELIRFKSTKANPAELKRVIDYIERFFDGMDVTIKRYERKGKHAIVILPRGVRKPKLLLCSHADVVEAEEKQFVPFRKGDRLYGRGAVDMKAGLAISLLLFKAHYRTKKLGLMITTDEEIGGFDGVAKLVGKFPAEFVVASEPTQDALIVKEKGVVWLKLRAKGKACHGSRPWLGENAIDNLLAAYARLRRAFPHVTKDSWKTTMNLGSIRGGDAPNRVPDAAELTVDIRYTEKTTAEKVIATAQRAVGTTIGIEVLERCPLMITAPHQEQVKRMAACSEEIVGTRPRITAEHGASDLRFFSEAGIPALVYGPKGANYHGKDEYVEIRSAAEIYRVLEHYLKKA